VLIQLVRLGEGTEATRRLATREQVKNWDLVTRLASARLVVTNRNQSTGEETVEVVHEALIRSWGRLGRWLRENEDFLRWQYRLEDGMEQWKKNGNQEGYLLREAPLVEAAGWLEKRREELSDAQWLFIQLSLELQDRKERKEKRRRQRFMLSLTSFSVGVLILAGVAVLQWHTSVVNELNAISLSAEALLKSNQDFDALIASIRAGRQLGHTFGVDKKTRIRVVEVLQQALNFVRERNRLEGHIDKVYDVSFDSSGSLIATASADKTVKLWNLQGELLQTFTGHTDRVYSVSFNSDLAPKKAVG